MAEWRKDPLYSRKDLEAAQGVQGKLCSILILHILLRRGSGEQSVGTILSTVFLLLSFSVAFAKRASNGSALLTRKAGRVDDLQIGSQARIDAFQVKWSQYQGLFTYRDLTQASGNAPALIAQLADGWQRLRAAYPGSRIVVHLVTNDIASPSTSQHMPIGEPPPTPRHFAAFIEQVWKPAKKALPNSNWSIPQVMATNMGGPAGHKWFVCDGF